MNDLEDILVEILEINIDQINNELTPDDVPTWDSFNTLMIVTRIEENFNIKLTTEDVVSVKCVGDIKKLLKKHGLNDI